MSIVNLPEGIKHALHMGANEAFLEWTCDPTEEGLDLLGTSYQGIGADVSAADAKGYIADLRAWDDGSAAGSPVEKFASMMYTAGIELARGMIAQAANVGSVPDRAKPYMAELAPLVDALKQALQDGDFDEEWLAETIWGDDENAEDDDDVDEE